MAKWTTTMKLPDSVIGRGDTQGRLSAPYGAVKNKRLMGQKPETQEYLLGELFGISQGHVQMFPEIHERLQKAKDFDWGKDLVAPLENANGDGYQIVNYGSFERLYEELVEPWLGKYETLKSVCDRFERGEINREEGAKTLSLQSHGTNRHTSSRGDNITSRMDRGTSTAYTEARLQRDAPMLYEKVKSGNLSANAAAIQAGFRKKATPFEIACRQIPKLTTEERATLREMLDD